MNNPTFVDTSALYALLDADDTYHLFAQEVWAQLLDVPEKLICSNYVIVETFALLQSRIGIQAVETFQNDIVPVVHVEWVTENDHQAGVLAVLASSRRRLSLVDCVSFVVMHRLGIQQVFCFDPHFVEQGFASLPGVSRG
jgi:predicted nucleic acid-binding protein